MNPRRDYRAARSQLLEEAGIRSSYASGAEIVEQENERDLGEVHDRVNVLSSGAPVFRNGPVQKFVSRKFVRSNGPVLDDTLLADPEIVGAIENEKSVEKKLKISDVDRSVVGRVGGAIAKKYGAAGFAGEIKLLAGQSFGCFLTPGLYLRLVGEANDYVGKGMAGGKIVISSPVGSGLKSEEATIVGNTWLYGATGAQLCQWQ